MNVYHPLFGYIEIPDTKEEIKEQIDIVTKNVLDEYSKVGMAHLDCLFEGLEILRREDNEI